MKRRLGVAIVLLTTVSLVIAIVGVASVEASKKKGSEGCTPGYWKQSQHFASWTGYTPDEAFNSVFEPVTEYNGLSLLDVLNLPKNDQTGLNILAFHTIAALLNTASHDVNYIYTSPQTVIDLFNGVYPGSKSDYLALKDIFAAANEGGCPLGLNP